MNVGKSKRKEKYWQVQRMTGLSGEIWTVSMVVAWEVLVVGMTVVHVVGSLPSDLCSPGCGYHLNGQQIAMAQRRVADGSNPRRSTECGVPVPESVPVPG
jgi:hypothetical protein